MTFDGLAYPREALHQEFQQLDQAIHWILKTCEDKPADLRTFHDKLRDLIEARKLVLETINLFEETSERNSS